MEPRWRLALGRRIRLTVLLLAGIVAGCASTEMAPDSSNPVQPHEVTIDEACGNPTRFPVSQECLNAMGYRYRGLLQHKTDLVMAVWRACPSASPCTTVRNSTPVCQELNTLKSGSAEYEDADSKCKKAYAADYSCNALVNDPEFQRQGDVSADCLEKTASDPNCSSPGAQDGPAGAKRWWVAMHREMACRDRCIPNDANPDCKQAQAAFADFQDRIQKAMLDAQLKAAFVPPQPIFFPPSPQPRP
jgi:hypothetical protein